MRKPITLSLVAAVLACVIAACGGSGAHRTATPTSGAAATTTSSASSGASAGASSSGFSAAGSKLSISAASAGALMFSTKRLHARAGTVTVTFTNRSPEGHNFTLDRSNGTEVGATPTFQGGSRTLTVHLASGTYTYFCSVPGHRQAGMQGTLTVS